MTNATIRKAFPHPCPVPGCSRPVQVGRLLCFVDWGLVSIPLQRTVLRLHAEGRKLPGFEEALANAIGQIADAKAAR